MAAENGSVKTPCVHMCACVAKIYHIVVLQSSVSTRAIEGSLDTCSIVSVEWITFTDSAVAAS